MSSIRNTLFPIYGTNEITKFILLSVMNFFVTFAITLTRDTKDTLIVADCGVEAIAFLSVYGVLPAAASFIAIYSKYSSTLSPKVLFDCTCLPFFIFFLLYDTFICTPGGGDKFQIPLVKILSIFGKTQQQTQDSGAIYSISNLISHWPSSLYYIVSEIYSTVGHGLLFWKLSNDVVTLEQASRFYPLFAYMNSLARVIAGLYLVRVASHTNDFTSNMKFLNLAILISLVMTIVLHHVIVYHHNKYCNESAESNKTKHEEKVPATKKEKKPNMTMMESIRFLANSEYLKLVSILNLSYHITFNFLEISWKSLVKQVYQDPNDYQRYMGQVSSLVGVVTFLIIIFGSNTIKVLGWRVGALIPPWVMTVIALPYFAIIIMLEFGLMNNGGGGDNHVLDYAVNIGTVIMLLSRAFKYGLFDPLMQMCYIPLDPISKVKGKAAIDVLASRVAKGGSAFVQQGLVMFYSNIIEATPAVMAIYYSISISWILASNRLGTLYYEKVKEGKSD